MSQFLLKKNFFTIQKTFYIGQNLKYTQRDKARILKLTTRTLQRWRSTKPELYALIEAGFKLKERFDEDELLTQEIKDLIKDIDKKPVF